MSDTQRIKNIIFDIGNVLVAFQWEQYYKSFGYSKEVLDRLAKATVLDVDWGEFDKGVLTEEEVCQLFIDNDPGIEAQIRETQADIKEMLGRYDYAVSWIQELKEKGYHVYYLSNFSAKAYRECIHTLDFLPLMDGGILSYRDKMIKPNPEIYHLLMDRYQLVPSECVFLDDTGVNIEAAIREGIHGIIFKNKEQAQEELRALGVDA